MRLFSFVSISVGLFVGVFVGPLMLTPSLKAQSSSDLDFTQGMVDFHQADRMLPDYLKQRAVALLEKREKTVALLRSPQDVAKRKKYIREHIVQALGGLPERTPLNAKTVGVLEYDDYKIEKVIFESRPNFFVTANLYLPKTGKAPYPGILFPLGHESGGKAHTTWQQLLITFAKKGYVAFTWDPVGQSERVQFFDTQYNERQVQSTTEHSILGIQSLLLGENMASYTVWDGLRALDYLLSRSEVDPKRIACTGNSGGGTHTAYLSALDDRIKLAMPSCFLTRWERLLHTIGPQDAEQVLLPWLTDGLDHPDFVHAFAPKPYLMLSAIRDFFSITGARSTYAEAKKIYALHGAEDRILMFESDDGHGYRKPRRLAAYRWLGHWFKDAEDTAPEPVVSFESAERLYCTKTGQVVTEFPKGETIPSLMQKRLAEVKKGRALPKPGVLGLDAIKKEVRRRVRELTKFEYRKAEPNVKTYGEIVRADGVRIEKLTYESEPGIFVPAVLFKPAGGGKKPAMIYVHGRGKSAGAGADGDEDEDEDEGGDLNQLVSAGYVVLAIDYRGTGETSSFGSNKEGGGEFREYFGDWDSTMTSFLLDRPLVGMRALDVMRGVDLLAARPEVDGSKIGGFGREAGAVPLVYAALFDDRIRQLALDSMLISYEAVVRSRIHRQVFESVVPGALKSYDLPDVVAALAPRNIWMVDTANPLGHRILAVQVKEQYAQVLETYKLAGNEGGLRIRDRGPQVGTKDVFRELF